MIGAKGLSFACKNINYLTKKAEKVSNCKMKCAATELMPHVVANNLVLTDAFMK